MGEFELSPWNHTLRRMEVMPRVFRSDRSMLLSVMLLKPGMTVLSVVLITDTVIRHRDGSVLLREREVQRMFPERLRGGETIEPNVLYQRYSLLGGEKLDVQRARPLVMRSSSSQPEKSSVGVIGSFPIVKFAATSPTSFESIGVFTAKV